MKKQMKKQMGKKMNENLELQNEQYYKKYYVQNEFIKILKEILNYEEDEGLLVFIKMIMCYEMIEDFSDYGKDLIDVDFRDFYKENKCFLCFIKFRTDDFLDKMWSYYFSKLNE
jgi:hypothetical protein